MTTIDAAWYRGGTSKCWLFDINDVRATGLSESELLAAAFGADDARQINGVGGATSTTSKAAIITPTPGTDVDLHYTFAQVGVGTNEVEFGSNCGNCASSIGLYALQRGLVKLTGDVTDVRMFNENSKTVLVARVATPGGEVPFDGDERIPGHAATGVRIDLAFENPAGRTTGTLLPTGKSLDELQDDTGMLMRASLVDAGAPSCLIPAIDLGLSGTELPAEFAAAVPELRRWRGVAAVRMGITPPGAPTVDSVPKVGVVASAQDYVTTNGESIAASDYDVSVRMVSMLAPHPAIGITSAVAVAAAATQPGSTVAALLSEPLATRDGFTVLRLGTPVGVIETAFSTNDGALASVSTMRVARRIASATIDLPHAHR